MTIKANKARTSDPPCALAMTVRFYLPQNAMLCPHSGSWPAWFPSVHASHHTVPTPPPRISPGGDFLAEAFSGHSRWARPMASLPWAIRRGCSGICLACLRVSPLSLRASYGQNQVGWAPRAWQDGWHMVGTQPFFEEGREEEGGRRGGAFGRRENECVGAEWKRAAAGLKPP